MAGAFATARSAAGATANRLAVVAAAASGNGATGWWPGRRSVNGRWDGLAVSALGGAATAPLGPPGPLGPLGPLGPPARLPAGQSQDAAGITAAAIRPAGPRASQPAARSDEAGSSSARPSGARVPGQCRRLLRSLPGSGDRGPGGKLGWGSAAGEASRGGGSTGQNATRLARRCRSEGVAGAAGGWIGRCCTGFRAGIWQVFLGCGSGQTVQAPPSAPPEPRLTAGSSSPSCSVASRRFMAPRC